MDEQLSNALTSQPIQSQNNIGQKILEYDPNRPIKGNSPPEMRPFLNKQLYDMRSYADNLIKSTFTPSQVKAIEADVRQDQQITQRLKDLYDQYGLDREKVADHLLNMAEKDPSGPWGKMAKKMNDLISEQGPYMVPSTDKPVYYKTAPEKGSIVDILLEQDRLNKKRVM